MAYFRPTLIPTLITIPALLVLIGLGTWQMMRLQWKQDLITHIHTSIAQPAITITGAEPPNLKEILYRRVLLRGTWLGEHERYLYTGPKVIKGKPGYNILTPFKTHDGLILLVDRGWVPQTQKDPSMRPQTLSAGDVTIEGMLHRSEVPAFFTPDNQIENNLWFWIDVSSMLSNIGTDTNTDNHSILWKDGYVRAIVPTNTSQIDVLSHPIPIPGEAMVALRNDHLQYAITWYSLAIALVIIYILYHRNRSNHT